MVFDLTTQLQPALWGLLIALTLSATALAASADLEPLRRSWQHRYLWRRRLRLVRARRDRFLARIGSWLANLIRLPALRGR